MKSQMRNRASSIAVVALVAFWTAVLSACGGSTLPTEFGTPGTGTGGEGTPKTFTVVPKVFGEDGTGSTSAAQLGRGKSTSTRGLMELREPPESRAALKLGVSDRVGKRVPKAGVGEPGTGTGSNGNDLVDLNGNNLFVAGLSDSAINASITFRTQGDNEVVGSIQITAGGAVATPLELSSKGLGSGQNLVVELNTGSGVSTAVLPSSFFSQGGNYGFNIVRRPDASLVLEIFPDNLPPAGSSDNGSRVVVDTAVDALKDGNLVTVARFETPDGLILFDSNLDGIFGGIEDGVRLFNTNGDFDEDGNPIIDQKDDLVSFALDPNLDGTTGPNETRLLGNNIPEDFINSIALSATPEDPVGNGLSTITLRTTIEPAFDGNPIGSTLGLSLRLMDGELQSGVTGGGANARFLATSDETLQRTIDPLNPSVRILAGGVIQMTDAIRTPILATDGKLEITVSYLTSTSQTPRSATIVVDLKRNTAPTLAQVNFIGTLPINPNLRGLEALSADARVVSGSTVQIIGSNFATDPAAILVTFGGVRAVVTFVSESGTEILCIVPEGATAGPIAVIQGSVGANTSENFIVAGPPIAIESVLPTNGATSVGLSNAVSVRFNQAISASSLANGFLVRAQGGAPVSGNSPIVSEDGRTVTFIPPTDLAPNTTYEIVLSGGLEAVNGVRFDADVTNDVLPSAEPELVVSSFTTGAAAGADTTPPTVVAASLNPPTTPNGRWEVQIDFSEGINPGSLSVSSLPDLADTVIFWQGSGTGIADAAKIPVSLRFEGSEGQVVIATLLDAPLGRSNWSLQVGTALTDTSGNNLAAVYSQIFAVPMRIDALSRISGPPGSEVVIEGSTFGTASEVSVTFAGENGRLAAQIVDAGLLDVAVTVPAGAVDGAVEISVGGDLAVSPRLFAVTTAGFTPRIITVGEGAFGIAVNFDDQALISFQGAGTLGLIDLSTETPIDINPATSAIDGIRVGGVPTAARLDQTGTLGFTTNYGSRETPGNTVFAIEMATRSVRSAVSVGGRPTRIAISPDNRRAYVTCFDDDSVSVIDIETLVVEATLDVGVGPNGIAISPDNQRGYVCNFLDSTVTVFEVPTLQELATFPVGANPARVHLSNDSRTLYVSNFGDDTISVIDTQTQAVLQVIQGFSGPSAMLFTTDEQRFFVTNRLQNTIQEMVRQDGQWVQGEIRIATGETPSALALSTDAALLVYTCEGSGEVGVVTIGDSQPVVSGFALNENGRPGRGVFNADRRQQVWIQGRGFGSGEGSLSVQVAGIPLPIIASPFATRRQILVEVPEEARSGSVIVTRTLTENDVRTSNSLPLLVTRRSPTVVSVTPGDGTVSVSPNSRVVVDMSEPLSPESIFVVGASGPVRAPGGAPVVRVVRLSDVGGSPVVIPGNWRLISQGFRLEFTPAGEDPFLAPESNNIYEVVVSPNVRDLYGNGVVGASTSFASSQNTNVGASTTAGVAAASLGFRSRFQTSDLLGPRIVAAVFRDLDNNGAGPGDQLELRFDEDLFFTLGSFDFAPALNLLGSPGDSLGVTVTATLGRTPRHLLLTLGVGARFTVTQALPSVNISGTPVAGVSDFFNNAPTPGQNIPITLDPASDNQDNPNLLAAYIFDNDASGGVTAGDELRLVFNEPVFRGTAAVSGVPSGFITLNGGNFGGATFIPRASGDDFRVLRILIAGNTDITPGITSLTLNASGTPLPSGLPAMAADAFIDLLGNPAYAGAFSQRTIGLGLPAAATLLNDPLNRPTLYDLEGTPEGLSEGDAIVVPYSSVILFEPLRGGATLRPADVFALGVRGDRFGSGARLAQPAFIVLRGGTQRPIAPNEVVIFLGSEPVLTPVGDFGVDLHGGSLSAAQEGRLRN